MSDLLVVLGWALALAGAVSAAYALLTGSVARSRWALALCFACLLPLAVGYALARPLDAQQLPFLIAAGMLAVALGVAGRLRHWQASCAALGFAAAALPVQVALGQPMDLPGLLLAGSLLTAPALAAALLLLRIASLPVPRHAHAWTAALAAGAGLAAVRMVLARVAVDDVTVASVLMLAAPAVSAAVLLLCSAARLPARVLSAALVGCLALSAAPSLAVVLRPDVRPQGLVTEESVRKAQYAGLISMDEEAGAGPKDIYRGKSFAECDAIGARDCFITFYDDLAMRKGVLAAVTDLITRVDNNEGQSFPPHCHQVVHNLGQLSYELTKGFAKATVVDPMTCATGFTHGLWEQKFSDLGPEVVFTRTSNLCRTLIPVSDLYQWSCSHILGHAMVNWMMADPSHATDYCTTIVEYDDRFNCNVGGWMNYFTDQTVLAQFTEYGSVQDVFAVCYGAKEGLHKYLCYQEIFPAVYLLFGDSDYLAGQACLTLSEPTARPEVDRWDPNALSYSERCVEGMARGVAVLSGYDFRVAALHCSYYPEPAVDGCLAAAASSIVLNTGSTEASNRMCQNVQEQAYKNYCYQWTKSTRALLASGPNKVNLPPPGVIRLPGGTRAWFEEG